MHRGMILVLAWIVTLVVPPGAVADHGGPRLHILHDVPDDGYAYEGNPLHFGYVLLDEDEAVDRHQQGLIRVVQNGVVLYETTADASHDYDALNTFQVAFPVPGPYRIEAEIPNGEAERPQAVFEGFAHPIRPTHQALIGLDFDPAEVTQGIGHFTVRVVDAEGNLIPHSDVLVEIRRASDSWLIFRTHLHTHEDPMDFSYAFPTKGGYLIRLVAYNAFPTPDGAQYHPTEFLKVVNVNDLIPARDVGDEALPPAGGSNPYKLLTTVDPQASNAPLSRMVLNALVYDTEAEAFVPHVNFAAVLKDDQGRVLYRSQSLHEYDGLYDLVYHWPYPGEYTLTVAAQRGDWVAHADVRFLLLEVLPKESGYTPGGTPLVTSAGAFVVTAEGLDRLKSGQPNPVTFHARTLAGTPAQHTEIDFQVTRNVWAPPLIQNKLHTHESGDFAVQVLFPEPGDYVLVLDPVAIHGEPDAAYYYGRAGDSLQVALMVRPGPVLPVTMPPAEDAPVPESASVLPGFEPLLLAGGLFALVWARRRRGPERG